MDRKDQNVVADWLKTPQSGQTYMTTPPSSARSWLRNKAVDAGRGLGFSKYGAQDLGDILAGEPATAGIGLADIAPGFGTYMGAEEGIDAYQRGDAIGATAGALGTAASLLPVVGPLMSKGVRAGALDAGKAFVNSEFGGLPIPPGLAATPNYADWTSALTPDGAEDPLAALIANTVNRPDPAVQDVLDLVNAGNGHLVTPELYSMAERVDPEGLRAGLAKTMPMELTNNNGPEFLPERVFHYSKAGTGNLPGNPPFSAFDPDRGGLKQLFDSLGPHVGTFDAADHRRFHMLAPVTTYVDSLPDGYTPDLHPDAAPFPSIPTKGSMMELAADLSRPFRPADAQGFLQKQNHPSAGNWGGFEEDDVWNEDDINNFISGWWDKGRGNMGALRQQMAGEGFTNVPYINDVESRGSTSHVMLTDRPEGRDAVLRDREALKHPALRHLPNLTAGVGGAGLSLGGLLAGDRDRQGY